MIIGFSLRGYVAIATNFMYVYVLLNVGGVTPSVLLISSKTVSLRSGGHDADNDF